VGVFNRFLPKIVRFSRVMHLRPCLKESPTCHYDHPWCGTHVLVTHPIDQTLVSMFETRGNFFANEAFRCCHDCLFVLHNVVLVMIWYMDINTKHVMWVVVDDDKYYYVMIGWGYVVLEKKITFLFFQNFLPHLCFK
jgi:hypothetical protein